MATQESASLLTTDIEGFEVPLFDEAQGAACLAAARSFVEDKDTFSLIPGITEKLLPVYGVNHVGHFVCAGLRWALDPFDEAATHDARNGRVRIGVGQVAKLVYSLQPALHQVIVGDSHITDFSTSIEAATILAIETTANGEPIRLTTPTRTGTGVLPTYGGKLMFPIGKDGRPFVPEEVVRASKKLGRSRDNYTNEERYLRRICASYEPH